MSFPVLSDEYLFKPIGDDSFMEHGACKGADRRLFFPKGGPTAQVKAICASCPVRRECLRWALDNEEYGFWGGTTTKDRARMLLGDTRRSKWRR